MEARGAREALRAKFERAHARLREGERWRCLEDFGAIQGVSRFVDFSSNDYLGLRLDPRLLAGGTDAARRYGSGTGASRLVLGNDGAAFALEEFVAEVVGWEGVVFLPSGFVANLALFDALAPFDFEGEGEGAGAIAVFLDARAHASLFYGGRASGVRLIPFRHGDRGHLERLLLGCDAAHKIVVVEALHSMDGDYEDLRGLTELCARTGALAVVDEAHTFGVCGPGGRGAVAALGPSHRAHILAVMLGCGKALGVSGGLLAGPAWFRERLIQKARPLLYSTGQSPFVSGAVRAALDIVLSAEGDALRARLQGNTRSLRERLAQVALPCLGAPESPVGGILAGDDARAMALSAKLRANGVLARAIRPPTVPRGTARVRLVSHAGHGPHDQEALCRALTSPA